MVLYSQSKTHDTVECRVHLQRSKSQIKCYNCGDDHFVKDCSKPKKTKKEPTKTIEQNLSIPITFNTNAHIPLEMWQNIKKQLKVLK